MNRSPLPVRPPIDYTHARSWFLLPATRLGEVEHSGGTGADVTIVDLEDGVIPHERHRAREGLAQWFDAGGAGWVRISARDTQDWDHDLTAIGSLPGVEGIVLAKCESAAQIADTAVRVRPGTPLVALVESALGVEFAFQIADHPDTKRLAFGSGDFRRDTGAGDDPSGLSYARSRLVVASRAAGLPGPVDGPTLPSAATTLDTDLLICKRIGLTGKLCLRTDDVGMINTALAPRSADLAWAASVIDELGTDGENVRVGSDLPRLARAKRIEELAAVFGEAH